MIIKLGKEFAFINSVIMILCNCTNSLDMSLNMRSNQKDKPINTSFSTGKNKFIGNAKKIEKIAEEPKLPLEAQGIHIVNEKKDNMKGNNNAKFTNSGLTVKDQKTKGIEKESMEIEGNPKMQVESQGNQLINEKGDNNIMLGKEHSEEKIEKVDSTILVLGGFESGKTTFCNLLLGKSIEDLPSTENFSVDIANIGDKKIRIIDSPDYFLGEQEGAANKSLGLRNLVRQNYDKLSKYAPDAIVFLCPYFPRFDKISDPYIDARLQLDLDKYKDQIFLLVQCDKKMEVKDSQFQGFLKSPIPIPAERRFLLSKTDLEAGKFLSIENFLKKVLELPKPIKSIWETIKDYESPGEKLMKNMEAMEKQQKFSKESKKSTYDTYAKYSNSSSKYNKDSYEFETFKNYAYYPEEEFGLSDHNKVIRCITKLIKDDKCPIEFKEKLKDVLELVEREEEVDYIKYEWTAKPPSLMSWSKQNEFISYYVGISSKYNKNLNREWRAQANGVIFQGGEAGGRGHF